MILRSSLRIALPSMPRPRWSRIRHPRRRSWPPPEALALDGVEAGTRNLVRSRCPSRFHELHDYWFADGLARADDHGAEKVTDDSRHPMGVPHALPA